MFNDGVYENEGLVQSVCWETFFFDEEKDSGFLSNCFATEIPGAYV